MIEYILLKVFLNGESYLKYFSYVKLDYYKDNNKEIYRLFLSIKTLQEKESRDYTVEELSLHFFSQYPYLKADDVTLYKTILNRVSEAEVDTTVISEYLESQRKQATAAEAAIFALDVVNGRKKWEDLVSFINKDEDVSVEEDIEFVSDDLVELYNETKLERGLRWRLNTLNKIFGSLRKGDFGFIFARPETGKTTFLASEATYMAGQTDRPIIWFNNEEGGKKVGIRCIQAALGITEAELYQDLEGNKHKYWEITNRKLKLFDDAGLTRRVVETVCKRMNPAMIIFDQIDKIYGFDGERYDLKMKSIYQWAREIAKQYGPVIAVCQAGGTGEGQKYLKMTDVDSSHTAKQGEADFILGIGCTNVQGEEYIRYLNACKNKLSGDEDSIPSLRHGRVAVNIVPEIARYADTIKWD